MVGQFNLIKDFTLFLSSELIALPQLNIKVSNVAYFAVMFPNITKLGIVQLK
jgi:hypothetical protein